MSRKGRANNRDPRDVFTKDLDLPRGRECGPVRERDRVYEINGTESRLLATVGAFRVVAESDLHDGREDMRKGLRHLEREGLTRTSPLSSDDRAVVLTDRGRDLLEANRHERQERSWEPRQTFYAGLRKPRELTHDSNVYPAYVRAEERIRDQGGRVTRVALDYERPASLFAGQHCSQVNIAIVVREVTFTRVLSQVLTFGRVSLSAVVV